MRRVTTVGGEPDGAPEETTHPACYEMVPQVETIRARARLTAFVITRMSSSSALCLALREADDGKRGWVSHRARRV